MKIILIVLLLSLLAISVLYQIYMASDEYKIYLYLQSPDKTKIGVIVANDGGGATGWCRDLIYQFNSTGPLPDLSKEKKNKPNLVKELGCGEAKDLLWKAGKLIIIE